MDEATAKQYGQLRIAPALDHLALFRRLTISAVLNYLYGLRFRLNIFHLYQHFFPQEYARSETDPHPFPNNNCHSPREIEFFELVISRLFPILDPEVLDDEIRFDGIPIEVCGLTCDDADQLDVYLRVVAAATGALGLDWNNVAGEWPVRLPAPLARQPGKALNMEKFEQLCRKRGGVWAYLPVVVRIICNETGNDFLDLTHETQIEWPPWTQENIEFLHSEWMKADEMLSQEQEVMRWLKESPRRMATVITLMNRATVDVENGLTQA